MTTPATQAILPVTPEVSDYVIGGPHHYVDPDSCEEHWTAEIQIVGGHYSVAEIYATDPAHAVELAEKAIAAWNTRQAHSLPGDVGTAIDQAILWARDDKCSYPADAEKFEQRIEILRAALTPSALSVPVGDDLAKGLRTSQKALDEIARQEQANIAGYLALRDFPVGSASGHFPPDEVGPNALGSDIPSIAAQLLEISRISNKYDLRECIEGHDDALGDSYIWRDLMDQCEKLGTNPSALSGNAGENLGAAALFEAEFAGSKWADVPIVNRKHWLEKARLVIRAALPSHQGAGE